MNIYKAYCETIGHIEDRVSDMVYIIACNNEAGVEIIAQKMFVKDNGEEYDLCRIELMTETDNGYKIILG